MNERFYLVALLSTYVYLKEHCQKIENCSDEKRDTNIDAVFELLQPLENYVHIPDKVDFLKKAYDEIVQIWKENTEGKEKEFFSRVAAYAKPLKQYEKREILNIMIYVVYEDNKISPLEKEFLLQLASVFGFQDNYKQLISKYEKSPFKKPFSVIKMATIAAVLIAGLIAGLYLYSKQYQNGQIHIFKDRKVMFNKLSFNRFIIYKNKFNIENSHFAKQAVFDISGTAEVGFDPKNIQYDTESKTVTYYLPEDRPFIVEVSSKSKLIDEANPVPLTETEAMNMSAGLALAGGFAGAKAGNSLSSFYPNPLVKLGATLTAGTAAGAMTGFLSFKALDGLQVSKNISKKEKTFVVQKSKDIIKFILTYNENLIKIYIQNFEKYIKQKFAARGLVVKDVIISNAKLEQKATK